MFYSFGKAAEYLKVSQRAMRQMLYLGVIKPTVVSDGGHTKWSREDLDKLAKEPMVAKVIRSER